jgi:hypothetical protein
MEHGPVKNDVAVMKGRFPYFDAPIQLAEL